MTLPSLVIALALWGQAAGEGRRTAPPTPVEDEAAAEEDPLERARRVREEAAGGAPDTPEEGPAEDAAAETPAASPLVPVRVQPPRIAPPDLVAQALEPPEEGALTGSPLTLVQVLSAAGRGRQLEATRLYWDLSAAMAEYHFALDEYQRLVRYAQPAPPETDTDPELNADAQPVADRWQIEKEAAAARTQDSELAALQAQNALAVFLERSTTDPLPLAADPPHVGPYRTQFSQIFARRSAPPRLRLIDRTLPIRRTGIDVRASAVIAAEDALVAAEETYGQGQAGMELVADRLTEFGRQRRAFVSDVRTYNHEIVEYVVLAIGEGGTSQSLAAMLIKPPATEAEVRRPPAAPEKPAPAGGKTPAGDKASGAGADSSGAKRRSGEGQSRTALRPAERSGDRGLADGAGAFARRATIAGDPLDDWLALADGDPTAAAASADAGLYTGLTALAPAKRAHKLVEVLHWDRALPAESGEPTALDACLTKVPLADRLAVVAAYWAAREDAARYQALAGQVEQLNALAPIVLARSDTLEGPRAMLGLRAATLAAEADMAGAHAALLAAEMDLTVRTGRTLDRPWLLPSTVPHAGRYQLHPAPATSDRVRTRALATSAREVPGRHATVEHLATAVVLSDSARVQAVGDYQLGRRSIDDLLETVAVQARETSDFLAAVTRYNQAIAAYASAVLPSQGADQFVSALVVRKTTSP